MSVVVWHAKPLQTWLVRSHAGDHVKDSRRELAKVIRSPEFGQVLLREGATPGGNAPAATLVAGFGTSVDAAASPSRRKVPEGL